MKTNRKKILDPCCGGRMFWFNKNNPLVIFGDKRKGLFEMKARDKTRHLEVNPDMIMDFTDLPFKNNSFSLVVFDPPHLLKAGKNSYLVKKYGKLPDNWKEVISKGFKKLLEILGIHFT